VASRQLKAGLPVPGQNLNLSRIGFAGATFTVAPTPLNQSSRLSTLRNKAESYVFLNYFGFLLPGNDSLDFLVVLIGFILFRQNALFRVKMS